jgi:hypothetical protein
MLKRFCFFALMFATRFAIHKPRHYPTDNSGNAGNNEKLTDTTTDTA